MTREIKFSYILQHEETGRFVNKIYDYVDIWNGVAKKEILDLDRYVLVCKRQFTGLCDKNGKEIYEGDILNWDSTGSGDEDVADVVKFEDGMFTFIEDPLCWNPQRETEIIGNIYENPELIKN